MLITFLMWKYFDTASSYFFYFLNNFYHEAGSESHLLSVFLDFYLVYKSFSIGAQVSYFWTQNILSKLEYYYGGNFSLYYFWWLILITPSRHSKNKDTSLD